MAVQFAVVVREAALPDVAGEEALLIKVGECNAMRWKDNSEDASKHDHSLLVFVRMLYAIDVGISGPSTKGAVDSDSVKDARFLILILGPNRPRTRQLNLEVGSSFAALLQDENVCAAAYNADDPEEFIEEFFMEMDEEFFIEICHI